MRRSVLSLLAALALLVSVSGTALAAPDTATGVIRIALTGDQEATATCAPPAVCGDPDATGEMILILNPTRDTVCFLTRWRDIDGAVVAAHIHLAPAGSPGGVVVPLFAGAFDGTDQLRDCVSGNGLVDDILANPAAYYVNIHSSVYPPGAIRGQLG